MCAEAAAALQNETSSVVGWPPDQNLVAGKTDAQCRRGHVAYNKLDLEARRQRRRAVENPVHNKIQDVGAPNKSGVDEEWTPLQVNVENIGAGSVARAEPVEQDVSSQTFA